MLAPRAPASCGMCPSAKHCTSIINSQLRSSSSRSSRPSSFWQAPWAAAAWSALAINQGYQRYQFDVIVIVVALILLMVQVIRWVGDMLATDGVDHR